MCRAALVKCNTCRRLLWMHGARAFGVLTCPAPPAPRYVAEDRAPTSHQLCSEALGELRLRYDAQAAQLEQIRKQRLPGRR